MDLPQSCKSIAFASLGPVFLVAGCRKTPHIMLACEATPPKAVHMAPNATPRAGAGYKEKSKWADPR